MVLLDLQKAFDTVDHTILCNKLQAMGIGSVDCFRSYLTNRTQRVKIDEIESESMNITCGVPQGSILGPLLFLCYVNDMILSVNCKLMLYADDCVLLVSGRDPNVISDTLSKNLESCQKWLVDNRLSLHLGKTESLLFGSKRKLQAAENFQIKCDSTDISAVPVVKYLGLKLDTTLSGEDIIESVVNKSTSRLKFLYRQAGSLTAETKKTLCQTLV